MVSALVVGFILVLAGCWGYGRYLENHPERTPAGRAVFDGRRREDEVSCVHHGHELALMQARYEGELAAYRAAVSVGVGRQVMSVGSGVGPVVWPSSVGALDVVDLDGSGSTDVWGSEPWWSQSAGLSSPVVGR